MSGGLPGVGYRLLDVRGMKSRVVTAVRSVVDAGAGNSDGLANALATDRDVRAAHADGQTRSRLGQVYRQTGENRNSSVEPEISHRPAHRSLRSNLSRVPAAR